VSVTRPNRRLRAGDPAPAVAGKPSAGGIIRPGAPEAEACGCNWNRNVFWEDFPWEKVSWFSREARVSIAAGPGQYVVDTFTIPRGQVLALTSVLFRVVVQLGGVAGPYFFLPDDGVLFQCAFGFMIGGTSPFDRYFNMGLGDQNRWEVLNRNIATAGVPWRTYAFEGQDVVSVFDAPLLPANATFALVEYQGVWIPKRTYDMYREKFTGGRG